MTPEAQRAAIAKAGGWTAVQIEVGERLNDMTLVGFVPDAEMMDSQGADTILCEVPDYLHDLNTRAAMLTCLDARGLRDHMVNNVLVLMGGVNLGPVSGDDLWRLLDVPQETFAKAFLVSCNLWEGTP